MTSLIRGAGTPKVEMEVVITKETSAAIWHATARARVLRDGEELLVAARLREVFQAAAAARARRAS